MLIKLIVDVIVLQDNSLQKINKNCFQLVICNSFENSKINFLYELRKNL